MIALFVCAACVFGNQNTSTTRVSNQAQPGNLKYLISVNGKITNEGDTGTHEFKMTAGKTYVLYAASKTIDTMLSLQTLGGEELAENDDEVTPPNQDVSLNSKIVYKCTTTGTYKAVIKAYDWKNAAEAPREATGPYTFTVREATDDEAALKRMPVAPGVGRVGQRGGELIPLPRVGQFPDSSVIGGT
jgi:hypothetical protein